MRPQVVSRVDARPAGHSARDGSPAPYASIATTSREAERLFDVAEAADLLTRMAAEAQHASVTLEQPDGAELPAAVATGSVIDAATDPAPDAAIGEARAGEWAVLLAPARAPTIAVAVLIEPDAALDITEHQRGGTLATMIAATTAEAALALLAGAGASPDGS